MVTRISQDRFRQLCSPPSLARGQKGQWRDQSDQETRCGREQEWYVARNHTVFGVVIYDPIDGDWSYFVFEKDAHGQTQLGRYDIFFPFLVSARAALLQQLEDFYDPQPS